jgi:hypothetical protein
VPLDGLWRFALDSGGRGRSERWWAGALPGDAEVPVPASFNAVLPGREARDHIGDVWYQRVVRVPRGWEDQRIVLRFDAATHRASVWVGEVQVAGHEGGYTPFEADISEHVRPGEQARVTVVVNTELRWDSIPPGFVQELEDGRLLQQYFHDFFNYTGLHRSVRPTAYPIPHDGPVGQMLSATGRHPWRPAHIHMIVRAPGHRSVTTHVFDRSSDYIDSDAVFAVKPSLLRDFVRRSADDAERPAGIEGPWWELRSDFVLIPGDADEPVDPGRTA